MKDIRTKRHHFPTLWAVSATEYGTVPDGEEAISWLLLTTYEVESVDDATLVVRGYSTRWRIEEFHRTWKRGGCRVEDTQLRDRAHIERWAVILASVAMRIERLKYLSRNEPDQPATVELTRAEIDAVILLRKPKGVRRGAEVSIGQATLWIAELGSYTGKSSGGPPGSIVLRRGFDRIRDVAALLDEGEM